MDGQRGNNRKAMQRSCQQQPSGLVGGCASRWGGRVSSRSGIWDGASPKTTRRLTVRTTPNALLKHLSPVPHHRASQISQQAFLAAATPYPVYGSRSAPPRSLQTWPDCEKRKQETHSKPVISLRPQNTAVDAAIVPRAEQSRDLQPIPRQICGNVTLQTYRPVVPPPHPRTPSYCSTPLPFRSILSAVELLHVCSYGGPMIM